MDTSILKVFRLRSHRSVPGTRHNLQKMENKMPQWLRDVFTSGDFITYCMDKSRGGALRCRRRFDFRCVTFRGCICPGEAGALLQNDGENGLR